MTNSTTIGGLLESTLKIDVSFYDEKHKKLLTEGEYPKAAVDRMNHIVNHGLTISGAEFLLYYFFHYRKISPDDYKSRSDIIELSKELSGVLRNVLSTTNGSIHTKNINTNLSTEMAEHIGESIGMLVTASIYNLIEVDWEIIPVKKTKDFDFKYAYTNHASILLETKGSQTQDNLKKSSSISQLKKDIIEKKDVIRQPNAADHFHGTITAIDCNPQHNVKCWLLDPPSQKSDKNIFKAKLLTRFSNITSFLSIISPKSRLIEALSLRESIIKTSENIQKINRHDLMDKNGNSYNYNTTKSPFFHHKTYITDKELDGGGIFLEESRGHFIFLGAKKSLIRLVEDQDFEEINNYKFDQFKKNIEITWHIDQSIKRERNIAKDYRSNKIKLIGQIYSSASGFMVGYFRAD
ncbi:hypothetical protein LWT02_06450 [Enterobacter bugandensis]|uniref:hypothetical protein n=1 Tax=Enterobacter TaxID=547 RepID=UPI001E51E7BD|nr:hypothetical protein [Enterobacter bugandensis]MCE1956485.1 hypothetical protein [Enterobacter bugandensis]